MLLLLGFSLIALLMFAAIYRNEKLLMLWIAANFIMCVLVCLTLVFTFVESSVKSKAHDASSKRVDFQTTYFAFVASFIASVIVFFVLFTVVVYCYICELRDKKANKNKIDDNNPAPEAFSLVPMETFTVQVENEPK